MPRLLALLLTPLAVLACVEAASSAFPGTNGRIAFVSDRDGNAELYSAAADGSDPRRLTTTAAQAESSPPYHRTAGGSRSRAGRTSG